MEKKKKMDQALFKYRDCMSNISEFTTDCLADGKCDVLRGVDRTINYSNI
jgi:hypothetical protein